MASDPRTPVVLCWHMHQPDYQDHSNGQFLFPWVYLHCIKDYVDMAAHLEAHPDARAVVNFTPYTCGMNLPAVVFHRCLRTAAAVDALTDVQLRFET